MKRVWIRGRRPKQAPSPALFCALPFTEVSVDEVGNVWPNCCPDWVDFPLGNLLEETWDEVWNGKRAKAFRASAHDGSLRHCDANWCPHIQAAMAGLDDWNVRPLEARSELDLPAEVLAGALEMTTGPVNVGMHYEASCNLACPTCRDDVYMVGGAEAEQMRELHDVVETELLQYPRLISLTGRGDPFASKFLRDFLIGFDRERFPTIEQIHLHTNAIMWTPRLWERMVGMHDIEVTTDISIDAARPETYELVRRPATWDRLIENLAFIGTIPNVTSIGISMVVSQANLGELVEFHDFGTELASQSDRVAFVEYKRVRRRQQHDDRTWRTMGLDDLDPDQLALLASQLRVVEERRGRDVHPQIHSNMGEFVDLVAEPRASNVAFGDG